MLRLCVGWSWVRSRSSFPGMCLFLLLALWGVISACSDTSVSVESPETREESSVSFAIRLSKLAVTTLARAEVVITAADMAEIRQELTISGETITGTVKGIPAGNARLFALNGYDAAEMLVYSGSTQVDMPVGEVVPVRITMRRVDSTASTEGEITVELPGGETLTMVWIEPGTFTMGSPSSLPDRLSHEGPQHKVTISQGFYLGKYELTQGQWESVMGTTPWSGQDDVQENSNHPAVYIGWADVGVFVRRLNDATGEAIYRLPSEGEWEYACRAGTTTRWSFGDDESQLGEYAWYSENALDVGLEYAQPVGTKLPNPWGLYDMHGNVWEWCQDWYGRYPSVSLIDPTGPVTGSYRITRGGAFNQFQGGAWSTYRAVGSPDGDGSNALGARLLRTR